MKKIIISLGVIAVVAAISVAATTAFFSDTETSTGNTFTAGTIDISVDGENPWNEKWTNYLDKPCQTNYMNFTIVNEGKNPARIWKRLVNVKNDPGDPLWPVEGTEGICSSEPEFEAGGGQYNDGVPDRGSYQERDNLSAFMIYDMAICTSTVDECPFMGDGYGNNVKPDLQNGNWKVLIAEANQVRVDNVADSWIKLIDELKPGEKLMVSQSYHLMTWDDSGQPMITNWAQGDVMEFDVELEARQMSAPAPGTTYSGQPGQQGVVQATVNLVAKDPITWDPIPSSGSGTLTYTIEGATFDFNFNATDLVASTNYSLIYYADPWPGNNPGALIKDYTSDDSGNINDLAGSAELNMDLPASTDANYPAGAKVWLVLTADYDGSSSMTAWNPTSYLFDVGLVTYNDTGI